MGARTAWVGSTVSFGTRVAFVVNLSWAETASLLDSCRERSWHAGHAGKHVTLALGTPHSESCRLTANRAPSRRDESPLVEEYGFLSSSSRCSPLSTPGTSGSMSSYMFWELLL